MEKVLNYIGGEFREPFERNWLDNINPATNEPLAKVPISCQQDVDHAVSAAKAAFPLWRRQSNEERAAHLRNLAHALKERAAEFSKLESLDNGKPWSLAAATDIPRSIENLLFFAEAIGQWPSESHHGSKGLNYTLRQPRGVAACISPWNLPLYLFTWKIAPALATGNTVVAKPSELTPMTAFMLAKLADQVGFPKGVLNIIHGPGKPTGEALINHLDVKSITFTGGTKTGSRIAALAAPKFKKISLELGGKNANIIFADCDFEKMLKKTLASSFTNGGQVCLCGSRILIESSLYRKFKSAFVDEVKKLKVGPPQESTTNQGALISEGHFLKVLKAIDTAKKEGGKILCGGEAVQLASPYDKGFYIAPTVIENLGPKSSTFQEEIFGPVVTLHPFTNDEEALELANDSTYGLCATIFTESLTRAHTLAERLEVGIVWINTWLQRDLRTPFGGTNGSGLGREGGVEALRFFTEPKNICLELPIL